MRPWQHAMSSAQKSSDWHHSLPVHEFIDISKTACAERRHRIVLHHADLGVHIVTMAFPHRPDVAELALQHVGEDLGRQARLSDWLDGTDLNGLPQPVHRRIAGGKDAVIDLVANRLHPSQCAAVFKVVDFLFLPQCFYPRGPETTLSVLMNSVGPAIVRSIFGPPVSESVGGQRVVTDWAWIAEAVIMACFGRIPDLAEVVRCVTREPVGAAFASGVY